MLIKGKSDRFRIFGGDLGKKGGGQYFRVGLLPWRTLCMIRPWHDTQAKASAHAVTCANQEKGGLGRQ